MPLEVRGRRARDQFECYTELGNKWLYLRGQREWNEAGEGFIGEFCSRRTRVIISDDSS